MPCEVCQMHDLLSEGIALVECLDSPREARLVIRKFLNMRDSMKKKRRILMKSIHVTSTSMVSVLIKSYFWLPEANTTNLTTWIDWDLGWDLDEDSTSWHEGNLPRLYHWMPCTSWPPAWRTWIGSWRPRKVGWWWWIQPIKVVEGTQMSQQKRYSWLLDL